MASSGRRASTGVLAFLVIAMSLGASAAQAQGLTVQLAPGVTGTDATTTDATGTVVRSSTREVVQRYRATFDRDLWPLLRLSLGGLYERRRGTVSGDLGSGTSDAELWTGNARLNFGGPLLSGALDYGRHEDSAEQHVGGQTLRAPGAVSESYSGALSWAPAELPSVDLRLSRSASYDQTRTLNDSVLDEALLSSRYVPLRQLDLRYSLRQSNTQDRLHLVDSRETANSGRISWADTFLSSRVTAAGQYAVAHRAASIVASGKGGTISTPQPLSGGFSGLETFPATPARITLAANPALVDGDTAASAGIDLGFGLSLAGDVVPREMGAQLAIVTTQVNTIYLWVDRPLPVNVSSALTFQVWQSDDNLNWSAVAAASPAGGGPPVQFSPFQNRFELTIVPTAARYLKVVARPLGGGVTVDARFRTILVTELQYLSVVAAQTQATASTSGILTTSARVALLRSPNLSYDFAGTLTHADNPSHKTISVVNGLSFFRPLGRVSTLAARVERADSDEGLGHAGVTRGSASVTTIPLPTVSATVSYNGQVSQTRAGTAVTNGLGLFDRLDLYEGLTVSSNASYAIGRSELGQATTNAALGANLSVVPNAALSLTTGYVLSTSTARGAGRPATEDTRSSLEVGATFAPVPALTFAGGVSRFVTGGIPATLASFSANASPFPRGDLLLRFGYSDTLDTAAHARTRAWGPSARWNIRQGWYLDTVYTTADADTPTLNSHVKSLAANLVITLR